MVRALLLPDFYLVTVMLSGIKVRPLGGRGPFPSGCSAASGLGGGACRCLGEGGGLRCGRMVVVVVQSAFVLVLSLEASTAGAGRGGARGFWCVWCWPRLLLPSKGPLWSLRRVMLPCVLSSPLADWD